MAPSPIPVATIQVSSLGPIRTTVPPISSPLTARFASSADLLGSNLPAAADPGAELAFDLYWRSTELVAKPYTVLVHLVDADGNVVAQGDGKPARPTTSWRPGEVIADARSVSLPADLAPGEYAVLVGLYDAADPAYPRLPVMVDGAPRGDGRVPLGRVQIGENENGG